MARFMHLFARVDNIITQNTENHTVQTDPVAYTYQALNVSRHYDFTDQLIQVPSYQDLEPFIQTWEATDRDKLCLYLHCQKDFTLFEWVLYEIFRENGHIVDNITAGRCEFTLAFCGFIVIRPQTFEVAIALLAILMNLQQTSHQFDIHRLKFDVEFPATYNIFSIEYSLSLARVNSFYLPFNPISKCFCKPQFCLQYLLMPVPGHVLGEQLDLQRDFMYEWRSDVQRFNLFMPHGEPINVNRAGRVAQQYHDYQMQFCSHIMGMFNIPARPYQLQAEDSPQIARKNRIMYKIVCWAEKWLYYDYNIMTKFVKKEQYRNNKRPYRIRRISSSNRRNES